METVCVSWDIDLVRRVEAFPHERLASLLCLLPPWQTGEGGWTTKCIASIWRGRSGSEEAFVFVDASGAELCCDMLGGSPSTVEQRRLVTAIQNNATSP